MKTCNSSQNRSQRKTRSNFPLPNPASRRRSTKQEVIQPGSADLSERPSRFERSLQNCFIRT
jgi:hypothetical protein